MGFVDRGLYDYHITESSPVRNTTPSQLAQIIGDEYLDPVNNKQRTSCTNVGAFEYEPIASVALDQLDHTAIRIAPNPASTSFTLSLPPSLIGSDVVIMNMQGGEVARYNIAQIPQQINIASMSVGRYVVRVGVHSTLLGIVR